MSMVANRNAIHCQQAEPSPCTLHWDFCLRSHFWANIVISAYLPPATAQSASSSSHTVFRRSEHHCHGVFQARSYPAAHRSVRCALPCCETSCTDAHVLRIRAQAHASVWSSCIACHSCCGASYDDALDVLTPLCQPLPKASWGTDCLGAEVSAQRHLIALSSLILGVSQAQRRATRR